MPFTIYPLKTMTKPKQPDKSLFFRKVLPWVVSIGILIYLLNKIPVTEVYEASAGVDLWMFIPVVLIGTLTYLAWDVLIYEVLFKEIKIPLSFGGLFKVRAASFLLNVVNHFIGTGSAALLIHRWKKIPVSQTGSVVVFKMFIEYHAIMALCLLTAFYVPGIDLNLFLEGSDEGQPSYGIDVFRRAPVSCPVLQPAASMRHWMKSRRVLRHCRKPCPRFWRPHR